MKKTTLIQCPLALCLVTAFSLSAAVPAGKSPEATHLQAENRKYAQQDQRAKESDRLAAAGEYEKAIRILKEDLMGYYEGELKSVDSWKAKMRYAEFSKKLHDLELTYGTIKMGEAQKAFGNGDYAETIKQANKAKEVCAELTPQANALISAANSRQKVAKHVADVKVENQLPNITAEKHQIKILLESARNLMKAGRYEDASTKVEDIFRLDPFNADAAYLANQIYKVYYNTGRKRGKADTEAQLAFEQWQWVEPLFPREIHTNTKVETIVKSADDYGIQKKLDSIILPKVDFNEAELEYVIRRINDLSKRFDVDKKGVIIDFASGADEEKAEKKSDEEMTDDPAAADAEAPAPVRRNARNMDESGEENSADAADAVVEKASVTLSVENVTLRELLNYVSYLTGLPYTVLENRVAFGSKGVWETRRHAVSPGVARLVDNNSKGIDTAAAKSSAADEGGDAEEADTKAAAKTVKNLSPKALEDFFKLYGVDFAPGSRISYNKGVVSMYNTVANQRKLAEILQELNTDKPMVQIEVKSIELTESDMEELGFNWALSTTGSVNIDKKGNWTGNYVGPGSNTTYNSETGSAKVLSMLGNALSGIDSRLVSNLNIFPDLLGSVKPFGDDQQLSLSLTINALDRSDRTEMISAPKVLVNNGETASVKMGKSYFFPESWDELEIEIEDSEGDNGYGYTLTLPTPSFGESQLMGTDFTVTPRVQEDNRTIRLDINPKITSYVGKDEYSMDVLVYRDGKLSEGESAFGLKVWRPVIATRSLDVQVDVYHGETLVLGGLSDSISQSRLDKIPILSDIPFIGRLFQSHSETSTRRNTLIFVTAKLMDSSGVPIRRTESGFGIPEMGR